MENIFGRIISKKFAGFNGKFGWKKRIVNGNNLENNKKNN